ncbi:hypothetical protein, partial [Pseudomonas putida]|uniref:hypothetical protein n=1 Tax=Pseudomonas putida TaxID=303 RepID=UPI003CC80908
MQTNDEALQRRRHVAAAAESEQIGRNYCRIYRQGAGQHIWSWTDSNPGRCREADSKARAD